MTSIYKTRTLQLNWAFFFFSSKDLTTLSNSEKTWSGVMVNELAEQTIVNGFDFYLVLYTSGFVFHVFFLIVLHCFLGARNSNKNFSSPLSFTLIRYEYDFRTMEVIKKI